MAHANTNASICPSDFKECVERLIMTNLHLSNILGMMDSKVVGEGETLLHSARRYLDDEFRILKHLEGDKHYDTLASAKGAA